MHITYPHVLSLTVSSSFTGSKRQWSSLPWFSAIVPNRGGEENLGYCIWEKYSAMMKLIILILLIIFNTKLFFKTLFKNLKIILLIIDNMIYILFRNKSFVTIITVNLYLFGSLKKKKDNLIPGGKREIFENLHVCRIK